MKDIKVGEYVKLARKQGINKIIEINEDGVLELEEPIADEWGETTVYIYPKNIKDEILEHSFELLDLIAVGDLIEVQEYNGEHKWIMLVREDEIGEIPRYIKDDRLKVISILTKEQFDRERYIVGG